MNQGKLLLTRRFAPFFWTQFLGAFNDNVFKNAMLVFLAFGAASAKAADMRVNLAAGLFILPFFLFSATAGQAADKYDKASLIRIVKALEVVIMVVGAFAFAVANTPALYVVLFLMGFQSSVFGPVKYSILPEQLRPEELVGGNAWVETGTFVAILVGTIAGGMLIAERPAGVYWLGGVVIVVAALGLLCSLGIPRGKPSAPELALRLNPWGPSVDCVRIAKRNRSVFLSILGISWFWCFGAIFLAQFPGYARDALRGDEHVVTALLAAFSIGIGAGSMLCERLSGEKIELGLVPLGAAGLTIFAIDVYFATPSSSMLAGSSVSIGPADLFSSWTYVRVLVDLALIGAFGGVYIVPLYALVQKRSAPESRSRVIAANNILNALFMVAAALLAIGARMLGCSAAELFLFAGIVNAAVAVYIFTLVPEFLMRFIVWMVMRVLYRLRQEGMHHIPDEGPATLVCNHVSFVDALVIAAACRRPIRFVMYHKIFRIPLLSFVFRTAKAIPIAPRHEDAELMERAFDTIADALASGDVIGIFPEGKITHHGGLNEFRTGIERILGRTPVPVTPMALHGLWGSFFSRKDAPAMTRPFRRGFRSRVTLSCGPPVSPTEATAETLQARVHELMHKS